MRFKRGLKIWAIGFALFILSSLPTRADFLCDPGEQTVITHELVNGDPATVIRCHKKLSPPPVVVKTVVVHVPVATRPRVRRRVHFRRRKSPQNLGDLMRSIFRPR